MIDLTAAGLNETEARVYQLLLSKKEWRPTEVAKIVGESRTNTYKILDDLTELGLAEKYDKNKKIHYRANHPTRLLELAQERRTKILESEKVLETNTQNLLSDYIKIHEQPGIRYFIGKKCIEDIYMQQINEAKPIQFLKTREDINFFGFDFMHHIRNLAPAAGIKRKAFTPDAPETPTNYKSSDKRMLLERVWYNTDDYTAPVEWSVYGDKVSIISFGEEAIGLVIESEQIAESIRQIFNLIEDGLKRRPNYDKLPKHSEYSDAKSFIAKYGNKAPNYLPKRG
jgi:predicted transcriptional regulator